MKTFVLAALLCVTSACVAPPKVSPTDSTATLAIRIVGLTSTAGQVRLAVFDSEESWLDTAAYETALEADEDTPLWIIENISYGDYGVAVFHDENRNGLQDRNLVGMPTEAYGFSNNARSPLGPATWEQAVILISSPLHELEIEVR